MLPSSKLHITHQMVKHVWWLGIHKLEGRHHDEKSMTCLQEVLQGAVIAVAMSPMTGLMQSNIPTFQSVAPSSVSTDAAQGILQCCIEPHMHAAAACIMACEELAAVSPAASSLSQRF